MALELVLCLLKEFAIGYLIGFIMQLFDYVVTFAGSLIRFSYGFVNGEWFMIPQAGRRLP